MESAALSGLALHPDAAAHQVHQSARRWTSRGRCRRIGAWWSLGLGEGFENDLAAFRGGIPIPVSATLKCKTAWSGRVRLRSSTRTTTSPLLGKLDGISHQIDEDLSQPAGISDQMRRAPRAECGRRVPGPSDRPATPSISDRCLASVSRRSKSMFSMSSLPASILEKSRMSLISASRESAELLHHVQIFALLAG